MDEDRPMYVVLFTDGRWVVVDCEISGHADDGDGFLVLYDADAEEIEAFEGVAAWTLMSMGDFYGNGPPKALVIRGE